MLLSDLALVRASEPGQPRVRDLGGDTTLGLRSPLWRRSNRARGSCVQGALDQWERVVGLFSSGCMGIFCFTQELVGNGRRRDSRFDFVGLMLRGRPVEDHSLQLALSTKNGRMEVPLNAIS
jgi:hypothetical protein